MATKKTAVQQKGQATTAPKKAFDANNYVTAILPKDDVIEIKQAFDIFDGDGSGIIDPAELKQAFIDLGFVGNNKFVYQILAELDEDGSGGIEFDEFLRLATAKASEKDSRQEINKVFNAFDKNRMKKFAIDELKRVAEDLGEEITEEELLSVFRRGDLDDDGFITIDDFYNIMTHRVYWDTK